MKPRELTPMTNSSATMLTGALMGLMVICIALQVTNRYVVHFRAAWTEELARILLLWVACAGATYGVSRDAHFRMSLLDGQLPGRIARLAATARLVISLLFLLLFAYAGLLWCSDEALERSATLPITDALPMAAIPLAGLCMAWSVIVRQRAALRYTKPTDGHS